MAELDREMRIATGRRDGDGALRLSIFAEDLLAVALEGHGERAPTLLLTREQAQRLRDALTELLPQLGVRPRHASDWQGAGQKRGGAPFAPAASRSAVGSVGKTSRRPSVFDERDADGFGEVGGVDVE